MRKIPEKGLILGVELDGGRGGLSRGAWASRGTFGRVRLIAFLRLGIVQADAGNSGRFLDQIVGGTRAITRHHRASG